MLRESRNAKPDHPLCHISDLTFSYAQVDEISGRVASALLGSGLRRGDKVAVQLPNLPQFLFTYFAILKAGLVMVPLNPLLKAPEVAYQLQDSESRMLITFEGFAAEAVAGARQAGNVPTYVVNLPGHDQRPEGTRHYDELYFADDTGEIEPVERRRHRGDHLHQRDHGQAQGRRADPLPAVHELHRGRRAVRLPRRRHRGRGTADVPRVRPVQRPQRGRAVRGHAGAHSPVRAGRGA